MGARSAILMYMCEVQVSLFEPHSKLSSGGPSCVASGRLSSLLLLPGERERSVEDGAGVRGGKMADWNLQGQVIPVRERGGGRREERTESRRELND